MRVTNNAGVNAYPDPPAFCLAVGYRHRGQTAGGPSSIIPAVVSGGRDRSAGHASYGGSPLRTRPIVPLEVQPGQKTLFMTVRCPGSRHDGNENMVDP